MTTREVTERRKLWLTWLELPWDTVRDHLIDEMHRVRMSQEDLAYELRRTGYTVTKASISNWLGSNKKPPNMDALKALVSVFAKVRDGEWAKGLYLSRRSSTEAERPRDRSFAAAS